MLKKGKKNQAEQVEVPDKTFQKLRHRHSSEESDINRLERHGLDRCLNEGLDSFERYCSLGVLAEDLHKRGNVFQEKARKRGTRSHKRRLKRLGKLYDRGIVRPDESKIRGIQKKEEKNLAFAESPAANC